METVSLSELVDALEARRGGVVVLPNARAARELRGAFDARMRAKGMAGWEAPAVLSWGQWTESLWNELVVSGAETRLLLNTGQEQSVWREIVVEDAANAAFGQADALAGLAISGWALASAYEATGKLRGFAATQDTKVFAVWAEAFWRRCGAKGYVAAAQLEAALKEHVERGSVVITGMVELVGFDEWTPARASLLTALRGRGIGVRELGLHGTGDGLRAAAVTANERDELEVVARWLRKYVEARPGARVAVLVPSLADERAELEDVLRQVLTPELQDVGADLSSTPWEIAVGKALDEVAMISDAMALARWVDGVLPLQWVSALLVSPYIGGAKRDAMARFDAEVLRRTPLLRPELDMAALAAMDKEGLLGWLRRVVTFLRRDGERSKARGYAEWMEFVRGLVQAAEWPGERVLTAMEFAATEAWESALDMVATLDFSGRRVSYAEALEALELQVRAAVVGMPGTGAPVQVMGLGETEGSVWDAVVLMRGTDANWPGRERAHPLLPWALQKSLTMPGSDAGSTMERARRFMAGLMERAGDVLFTSAAEDADGRLRPSPLSKEFGLQRVGIEALVEPVQTEGAIAVESVMEEALPELSSGEIGGGAAVIKAQAACAFRAFAEFRLQARDLKGQELGMDAGESGGGLHKALQDFWRTVGTQEALKRLANTGQLDDVLRRAIDRTMERHARQQGGWEAAYVNVQKERMYVLLRQWMEWELKRGPFEVFGNEQEQTVKVGPLTVKVRYDRIDRVGDGFFLVDYKTGAAGDPKHWDGERPDDPQLPLYALPYEPHELKGMAFAKVRAGEMKWLGVQGESGILPGARADVQEMEPLLDGWRTVLTQLAQDFADGRVDVRPKEYPGTCVYCAQRILCRLDPETLQSQARDDEGEDAGENDG